MDNLFLRRVSLNGSPPETPDANTNNTIISLENKRTTFGNVCSSDVLLVEGTEDDEKDAKYIHRKQAHIISSVTTDGTAIWTLYDHSDSGTYVDGERVTKNVPKVLQAQSILIFGHETREKGDEKPDPGATFVFLVDTTRFHQSVVPRLAELKDHQLKVYSKTMVIKDMGARITQTVNVGKTTTSGGSIVPQKTGVQQREADSTMTAISELAGPTESLPSTSSASSSTASAESPESAASTSSSSTTTAPAEATTPSTTTADAPGTSAPQTNVDPGSQPSTSWSCDGLVIDNIPSRAPPTNFADPRMLSQGTLNGTIAELGRLLEVQARDLLLLIPQLRPAQDLIRDLLAQNLTCGQTIADGKELYIDDFCAQPMLRNDPRTQLILDTKRELAEFLASEEDRTGNLMQGYVEHARALRGYDITIRQNPFTPSPTSAFRATGHLQQQQLQQPTTSASPMLASPFTIHRPQPLNPHDDPHAYLRMLCETNAESERVLPVLKHLQLLQTPDVILRALGISRFSAYEHQMQLAPNQPTALQGNYTVGLHRTLEMVPVGGSQQHGGVIARAPGRRNVPEMEVDEERHSASSGSTADHNYAGRRRTASEESEIVDVVGMEEEEEEEEEDVEKGTSKEAEKKAVEEPEEDETTSSTPRIDAQSTPSAVVSAVPSAAPSAVQTPLSSPIPKKAPESALHSPKIAEVAPPPKAPTPAPTASTTPAPAPESPETVQKKVEENVASIKATMSVVAKASSAASTSTSTAVTASVAVTVATTPSDAKKKTPATKERRMKQLDDASSADSESEDDESKTKKKKPRKSVNNTPKRPGRAVAAGSAAKKRKVAAAAAAAAVADDAEGSDDVADPDTASDSGAKATLKSGRRKAAPAKQQQQQRAADNGGDAAPTTSRRRKRPDGDGDADADETPVRRRRVGKKSNDDSAAASPAAGADDGDKEKCGVAKTHCLCKRWEKKRDLQWVSCAICEQWFHVFCVRLNNHCYGKEDVFNCCGDNPSPEAVECLAGAVLQDYKTRRIKPQLVSTE